MISVFHSDVEVYVCLTEQFEMFWRGVKGISSERKTYQGLRKFRCECPRCQAIDDTRGMQCDRCGPSGHVGTWSPGCFFWFYSMTPWAISKGWFSRNGYCSWWMLVISADAPEKNWSMTSSLSLFPSFFVGASPMFFEIKSNNPVVAQIPPFLLVKISGFCGLHSSFAWVLGFGDPFQALVAFSFPVPGRGYHWPLENETWSPCSECKAEAKAADLEEAGWAPEKFGISSIAILYRIPPGYVKIAIENGHRNSEFSH